MNSSAAALAVVSVIATIFSLAAISPAAALSAELAKECRAAAIKAHPRTLVATTPYAQAQRDAYRQCIANNGDIQNNTLNINTQNKQ